MNKIAEAKALLEENGYLVVRRSDQWIASRLRLQNRRQGEWINPRAFCKVIGIDRHTLTRHLKDKDCPKVIIGCAGGHRFNEKEISHGSVSWQARYTTGDRMAAHRKSDQLRVYHDAVAHRTCGSLIAFVNAMVEA